MKLKLKGKLMIMFFLSITVPLTVLGVVSTGKAAEAMRTKSTESANKLVNITAQNMEENIDAVIRDVSMLTNNPSIINLVKGNETSRDDVYNFLNLVQSENKEIIESLIITNDKGQAICTNDSKVSNIDFSDREYVKSTLKGEKSISKEILTSKITGDKIIAIAHPLMNSDKVMGTVIALVSFDNLTSSISNLKIGETGYGFMLDKDGMIIKHPVKEKEFNENLGDSKDNDLKLIVEKMKSGESGSGYYTYNGVKKFVGFTYIGGWSIALTQNDVEIMEASNYIRVYTIIFTCIVIAISMVLVYLYSTRKIINPIKELQKLMGIAGGGDLTVKSEIKTKDEIEQLGESFNDMINNQSEIINNVRINASDLAASSEEISASTEEMSASTELVTENIKEVDKNLQNQNNMILETTEVLVDLSKLIKVSQNKAETTKNNSSNTMEVAKRGRAKVEETVVAINNINKATIQTEDALKSLEELSTKIVGIISTINSISEQTNLLALNAAIEAARAGENGRGFSVVADEVRTLSEESSIGAKEISVLVNSMVAEIKNAVATMGNGKNAVNIGVVVASETDKAFIDIIKSVDQMVSDIEQIVDVTKEEVSNSDKIVDLLKSVEKVCDNTAKSGHEVSVASEEQYLMISNITEASQVTSTMAMKLNELVDKFIIK